MAEKLPCFTPQTFSGKQKENVKSFLSHYERVAVANSWQDERKLQLLPFYVTDTAHLVLENLEREHGDALTWEIVKETFLKTFSLASNTEILEMQLNSRVHLPGESTIQYMSDVIRLCSEIDTKMAESRVCGHILKGMNPAILQQIAMWDNSTKDKLFENISKYEKSSLLLRHRLGAEMTSPPMYSSSIDLKSKIDTLTEAVNQLKLEGFQRHRSESRDSRYSRDLSRDKHWNYSRSGNSRDSTKSYTRGRDRSTSRGRVSYNRNGRHPRSRDRYNDCHHYSRSPTPSRVSFNKDYTYRENRNNDSRDKHFEKRNPSPYPNRNSKPRPSQPCRHCGKLHWSQDCRNRKSKN